jgi:hypothetical protein
MNNPAALKYVTDVMYPDDPDMERARRVREYREQWNAIERRLGWLVDAPARVRNKFERDGIVQHAPTHAGGRAEQRIVHQESGREFASIMAAARWLGVSGPAIHRRLRHGLGWARVEKVANVPA